MVIDICIITALLIAIIIVSAEIRTLKKLYSSILKILESQREISERIVGAVIESRSKILIEQEKQRAAIKLLLQSENERREKEKTYD